MEQNLTAIIYNKKGKILSIGKNSYSKTHPLQAHHAKKQGMPERIFLHAEIAAIVKCPDLTKAYRMQVIRTNKEGRLMYAKPCAVCMSAINSINLKQIEWSID
jgi:tRNA(Arg) A34 adenosine deaminase TadA